MSTPFSLLYLILITHFHKNARIRPDMFNSVFFFRKMLGTRCGPVGARKNVRLNFVDISVDNFL